MAKQFFPYSCGPNSIRLKQPERAVVSNSKLNAEPARLGESAGKIMYERLAPMVRRNEVLLKFWWKELPEELRGHCTIESNINGQLKLSVDSASYLYTAQMISGELLERIQRDYPQAGIKSLRFIPG